MGVLGSLTVLEQPADLQQTHKRPRNKLLRVWPDQTHQTVSNAESHKSAFFIVQKAETVFPFPEFVVISILIFPGTGGQDLFPSRFEMYQREK